MSFVAPTPWSAERPNALVVCCSDGRWHAQMMEFVREEVCVRPDLYAVPGGPAVLDPWNSSFDEARAFEEGMRLFEKHHKLESAWLIAHEGCAFYREKHPHFDAPGLRRRQVEDLMRARKWVLERHPQMDVRLIFASLRGTTISFEPCAAELAEEKP